MSEAGGTTDDGNGTGDPAQSPERTWSPGPAGGGEPAGATPPVVSDETGGSGETDDTSPDVYPDTSPDVYPGEDPIPPAPLWAMRVRMHSHRHLEPGEDGRIQRKLGDDDAAVYVIDDGLDHCMVGRRVGRAPDGCVYCLVARISLEQYGDMVAGELDLTDVFTDARDISLCGVFEEDEVAANVLLVQHYRRSRQVPADYLPPSPFLEFTDDPDASDHDD